MKTPVSQTPPGSDGTRRALWVMLIPLSGMAGLTWEVLWQHLAGLALGVSAQGAALTLACTMGGMAAGALLSGRLVERVRLAPLRIYSLLELIVGLAGLGLAPGFHLLEGADTWLHAAAPALTPLLQFVGIALLLGPPALAMGATVPVFRQLTIRTGLRLSLLYGINTAGASVGVVLGAFAMIPTLGLSLTTVATVTLNLLVALGAWLGGRDAEASSMPDAVPGALHHDGRTSDHDATAMRDPGEASRAALAVVTSGAATFLLEVAWFRSLRAAFQSTTDSFAIMLAAVLGPLALGAHLGGRLRARPATIGAILVGAGVLALGTTPIVERFDQFDLWVSGYYLMQLRRLGLTLLVIGPCVTLLGTALPAILDRYVGAAEAGRLYALNTIAAVAGALAAGWLLLPWLGAVRTAWLAGLLAVTAGAVLLDGRARLAALLAGAAALGLAFATESGVGRLRVQNAPGMQVLAHREGPDATISVVEAPGMGRHLYIDGFETTGEAFGAHYMAWMGRLPMLLSAAPRRALVICFGTGQTANAVRQEGPEHLDVVELSPAVIRLAGFFPSNQGVLADSRVRTIIMDGRAWLRRSGARYDVITLEPMAPDFAGSNALYSHEFYQLAATRLDEGGILAQWLPLHLLPPATAAAVVRTFHAVFPDSALWLDPQDGTGILLGQRGGRRPLAHSDWPGLARPARGRNLDDVAIRRFALDAAGVARYASYGALVTDDNQLLSYGPGRREASRFGDHYKLLALNHRLIEGIARGETR